jgi:hypothetical protein
MFYLYILKIKTMAKGMEERGVKERKEETFPRFGGEEVNEFPDEANRLLERGERTWMSISTSM